MLHELLFVFAMSRIKSRLYWLVLFGIWAAGTPVVLAQSQRLLPLKTAITENSTDIISALRPDSVLATTSYSQGIRIDMGTTFLVFIAGQVAIDERGNIVGAGNMRQQTEQVFVNIRRIIEAAGGTTDDIVKLTLFLTDMANAGVVREIRGKFVNNNRPPTSAIVQVSRLFRPEYLIEIEAIAVVRKR